MVARHSIKFNPTSSHPTKTRLICQAVIANLLRAGALRTSSQRVVHALRPLQEHSALQSQSGLAQSKSSLRLLVERARAHHAVSSAS
eukprot:241316-Chlamydomonas_euryale.AAC.2